MSHNQSSEGDQGTKVIGKDSLNGSGRTERPNRRNFQEKENAGPSGATRGAGIGGIPLKQRSVICEIRVLQSTGNTEREKMGKRVSLTVRVQKGNGAKVSTLLKVPTCPETKIKGGDATWYLGNRSCLQRRKRESHCKTLERNNLNKWGGEEKTRINIFWGKTTSGGRGRSEMIQMGFYWHSGGVT